MQHPFASSLRPCCASVCLLLYIYVHLSAFIAALFANMPSFPKFGDQVSWAGCQGYSMCAFSPRVNGLFEQPHVVWTTRLQVTPFAEPAWYSGDLTPYYNENHCKWRKRVRDWCNKELAPKAHEWDEVNGSDPKVYIHSLPVLTNSFGILSAAIFCRLAASPSKSFVAAPTRYHQLIVEAFVRAFAHNPLETSMLFSSRAVLLFVRLVSSAHGPPLSWEALRLKVGWYTALLELLTN